jgi:hypothetical protein
MHESWAFREWRYIDKLLADPVIGRYSPKVYTVNNDDAATGLLRGAYSCLPARRFDDDLHVAVPFLARPNEEVLAHAGKSPGEARCLGVWRGNPHSNRKLRGQLLQLYGGSKNFEVESTDSWKDHGMQEKLRYVQMLRSGKFSLCPGGCPCNDSHLREHGGGRSPGDHRGRIRTAERTRLACFFAPRQGG